jgi:hypothetical protein
VQLRCTANINPGKLIELSVRDTVKKYFCAAIAILKFMYIFKKQFKQYNIMGCFSFLCKESGLPVASDSFSGDACRLYLLKDGKVLEEMRGHYDSYGRVFSDSTYKDSFHWKMEWGEIVSLMFTENEGDGMAVVLEKYFTGVIPTTRSESDRNQGWGDYNGGNVKIDEPVHMVLHEVR